MRKKDSKLARLSIVEPL